MITKILTDRVNFSNDVKEVRQQWLCDLFLYIGLDGYEMLKMPRDQAIDYMLENNVELIEYKGIEALEVRYEGETIGEWAGPEYRIKEDPSDQSLYFEATIEHWSIKEDDMDISSAEIP
jgi:hypothetical protein